MRSKRMKDPAGVTVTGDYVLKALAEMGVPNPNRDNLKLHWAKHCEVVQEQTKEELEKSKEDALRELRERAATMTFDELMDWVARQGVTEAMIRDALEGKSGVTLDHSLKAVDVLTRRKEGNSQRKFFEALGGGIAKALAGKQEPEQVTGEVVREIEAAPADFEEVTA